MAFFQKQKKDLFRTSLLRKEKPQLSRRKDNHERKIYSVVLLSLWVLFAALLAGVLFLSPWLNITELEIRGESVVDQATIKNIVQEQLSGKYLHLFSKKNLFLVPRNSITERLIHDFPKFSSITVTRVFPNRLLVNVTERPYLLIWCSGGPCSLIDESGRLLPADQAQDPYYAPWLLTIIDRSAMPITRGTVLPLRPYADTFILFKSTFLKKTGIDIESIAETPTRYANELRLRTAEGWTIFISTEIPARESLATVTSLLEQTISVEKRKDLLSIDLRIPGRAFIGYKNLIQEVSLDTAQSGQSSGDTSSSEKKKEKSGH